MHPTLAPALAQLSSAEKLQLVGELWDELTKTSLVRPLTPAQETELRAEREAIRRSPHEGSLWPDAKERILRK